MAKIIQFRYYQNYSNNLNQILYSDKNHQEHVEGGPEREYNKLKMADGRYFENQ